ncbi:hypothetical protein Scep_024474 [Stephania cephalantha]|uniref:Uncharacterized protein n=1 Tax=Stephania cephalantha TaxID=152367 RepID=A0AAP0EX94_9MAGN
MDFYTISQRDDLGLVFEDLVGLAVESRPVCGPRVSKDGHVTCLYGLLKASPSPSPAYDWGKLTVGKSGKAFGFRSCQGHQIFMEVSHCSSNPTILPGICTSLLDVSDASPADNFRLSWLEKPVVRVRIRSVVD